MSPVHMGNIIRVRTWLGFGPAANTSASCDPAMLDTGPERE